VKKEDARRIFNRCEMELARSADLPLWWRQIRERDQSGCNGMYCRMCVTDNGRACEQQAPRRVRNAVAHGLGGQSNLSVVTVLEDKPSRGKANGREQELHGCIRRMPLSSYTWKTEIFG